MSSRPDQREQLPAPQLAGAPRRGVTPRALVLGLIAVVFVAAVAPYNSFALGNSNFIGSHFPTGVTLMMILVILVINPLLRLRRPSAALSTPELITIWAMCLVASAFPMGGLVRNLLPWIVSSVYQSPQHPEWDLVLQHLPAWLFPTTDPYDPVVTDFFLGREPDAPLRVPWSAWAGPVAIWGLYYVPLFVGLLLVAVLLSRQWIEHEKLQYPIAAVMLEMAREPEGGRSFNALMRHRGLWLGAGVVMAIHLVNGLHNYYANVPQIPLRYDLTAIFTEGLWQHWDIRMQRGAVCFVMVGIAFLMSAEISLTLWSFTILYSVIYAVFLYHGVNPWEAMRSQGYGAVLGMAAYLLFLARAHLWRASRMAIPWVRPDPDQRYAAYRWVVRGLVLCIGATIAWLCATGMPLPVAAAQVAIIFMIHLVMARVVAETGMFLVWPMVYPPHLFPLLAPGLLSAKSQALVITNLAPISFLRETLMPFAFNALRLGHEAAAPSNGGSARQPPPGTGTGVPRSLVVSLMMTIVISMLVAGFVSMFLYYDRGAVRLNNWISLAWGAHEVNWMMRYAQEVPLMPGQGPMHVAIGAGLVLLLGLCRMRFARWPFIPIVLCLVPSGPMTTMWFSILIGWICKTATMRVGGVPLYNRFRPIFLGVVIGEILMAGVWMVVGAVIRFSGHELPSYRVLTG